jgi:NAD(P)H-dependent FMN reductase
MKVLAFATSNSSNSINKRLATYAASLIEGAQIEVLDLNDFEMPIYSSDREAKDGVPQLAKEFISKIENADVLVASQAEHNGTYPVAFKNILDWSSRASQKLFADKPTLLLSTSPGPRGASTALEIAQGRWPYLGAAVKGSFTLPSFYENFDLETNKIKNEELNNQLKSIIKNI